VSNPIDTLTGETVELLRQLIRNRCVNDGTPQSGQERRSAELLRNEIEGLGLDFETYEPEPGRTSLLARYEGTDPEAPALCLMAHTDVVPVDESGWDNDPFGGEIIAGPDGTEEVWGRGAVDMLNLTSSMFVAFRHAVRSQRRYPGDIVYLAVADEEAAGTLGAKHIVENHPDDLRCDYVITEYGGVPTRTAQGTRVLLTTGEKQGAGRIIKVTGTPGHGSMPYGTDNALVKAAAIVGRIADHEAAPRIDEMFAQRVRAMGLDAETEALLLDPARIAEGLARLPPGLARNTHSCAHVTMSPNLMSAGDKANIVASSAEIVVDIRMLQSDTQADIDAMLEEIIGPELMASTTIEPIYDEMVEGTPHSPTDTPLWDALADSIRQAYPGAEVLSSLVTVGTDARFFRQRGITAYGAGLLSERVSLDDFLTRFHGHNERIDVDSLRLTTQLWTDVFERLWR